MGYFKSLVIWPSKLGEGESDRFFFSVQYYVSWKLEILPILLYITVWTNLDLDLRGRR